MIGETIIKYRKNNNLKQADLALKLNVSNQTISNWEQNKNAPSLEQALNISELFNISLDELMNIDNNEIIKNKINRIERQSGHTIKILKILLVIIILVTLYRVFYASTSAWFVGGGLGRTFYDADGVKKNYTVFNLQNNANYVLCPNCNLKELTKLKELANEYYNYEIVVPKFQKYIIDNGGRIED